MPSNQNKMPKHDPNKENALVMDHPPNNIGPENIVDVVVDPIISKHLRPHQKEGVKFLYNCLMGFKTNVFGAILADELIFYL
jgi:DNA repair and recombination protein RAD54B